MLPMVGPPTGEDPNEPNVVVAPTHHLVVTGVDRHFAAAVAVTPSFDRPPEPITPSATAVPATSTIPTATATPLGRMYPLTNPDEIDWLRSYIREKAVHSPRDAIVGFGEAMTGRNGPAARVFLAPGIRDQIPPLNVGLSHPHLGRYEILGEKKVDEETYLFQVRFYTDVAESVPYVPGQIGTFTVRNEPSDFAGNRFWVITDMPKQPWW